MLFFIGTCPGPSGCLSFHLYVNFIYVDLSDVCYSYCSHSAPMGYIPCAIYNTVYWLTLICTIELILVFVSFWLSRQFPETAVHIHRHHKAYTKHTHVPVVFTVLLPTSGLEYVCIFRTRDVATSLDVSRQFPEPDHGWTDTECAELAPMTQSRRVNIFFGHPSVEFKVHLHTNDSGFCQKANLHPSEQTEPTDYASRHM